MSIRRSAAVALLALAVTGCATEDYGYARASRFDRPYLGGAASVQDTRPQPVHYRSDESETVAVVAFFAAIAIAIVGHADVHWSSAPTPEHMPPPPPPSGR